MEAKLLIVDRLSSGRRTLLTSLYKFVNSVSLTNSTDSHVDHERSAIADNTVDWKDNEITCAVSFIPLPLHEKTIMGPEISKATRELLSGLCPVCCPAI